MHKLIFLLERLSAAELKKLATLKGSLEVLEKEKNTLERNLQEVDKQLQSLEGSLRKPAARRKVVRQRGISRKLRKRIRQPSLSSVVVEVFKEKNKLLKVNDLVKSVLEEKKYKTQSKNFKGQLRTLLYKNEKGLFKKTGPGLFTLAGASPKGKKK